MSNDAQGTIYEIEALDRDGRAIPLYDTYAEPAKPLTSPASAFRWTRQVDAKRPVFLTIGPAFLKGNDVYDTAQKQAIYVPLLKDCDVVACDVPQVQVGQAVAQLRELAGAANPVYAWIETKGAKPEDILPAVRAAIKNGATGIGYRGFEGLGVKVKPDAAVMAELKKINDTITAHAAELLADPSKAEFLLK